MRLVFDPHPESRPFAEDVLLLDDSGEIIARGHLEPEQVRAAVSINEQASVYAHGLKFVGAKTPDAEREQ